MKFISLDTITLFLALWGAILSTILGVRELSKDKRSLKVILESVHWYEIHRILITNIGHRSITIDQIFIQILTKLPGPTDPIPSNSFWLSDEGYKPPDLPITLKDGEMVVFYLSREITEDLNDKNKYLSIKIIDAEGISYTKYSEGEYDPKYGYRSGKYKPPGRVKSFFLKLWWRSKLPGRRK